MVEEVYINYLMALGKPFADFSVTIKDIVIKNPVSENMRRMYETFKQLSFEGVADVEFHNNQLFIKGNADEVSKKLKEIAFISEDHKYGKLNVSNHRNIMRALFYKALSRYVTQRNLVLLWGKRKRKKILPLGYNLDELVERNLAVRLDDNLILYRGLYVMLEIFDDGGAILWIDLYSPIFERSKSKPLSPREAKMLGLKDKYVSFIPSPRERMEFTNRLLRMLCEGTNLNVQFPDGFSISFICNFPVIKVVR